MNSIVVEEPVQLSLALSASAGLESNGSMFSIDMPQGDVLPKQTSLSWRFHIHPHEGDSSFSEVSDVMPVFIKLEKELQDLLFQSTPLQEQDLINNFLAKPPVSRTARREAPASPLEEDSRASSSITSDDSLVTETLAQLYLKQNHPSEAIRVYEQLCLRYPEKISYFTTQIQKIKENKL
ncbi:MAG: hypothetical protein NWR72_11185 [Bacteroidia bacterium]|nr:hypothetical protein [Bacteroidia bacterium]